MELLIGVENYVPISTNQSGGGWQLLRSYWLRQAARTQPQWYEVGEELVDWDLSRAGVNPAQDHALHTWRARAVNTKDRSCRHFQSAACSRCENGCVDASGLPVPNDPTHRLLDCKGTEKVREIHGLSLQDCDEIRLMHPRVAECAVWCYPKDFAGNANLDDIYSLWLPSEIVEEWMQVCSDPQKGGGSTTN